MTTRRLWLGASSVLILASVTFLGLRSLVAQDASPAPAPAQGKAGLRDEVVLEQPFDEVSGKVPDALKKSGFVAVAEVDWTKLAAPDGKPLGPGARRVRTFQFATPALVKSVLSTPQLAFFAPAQLGVLEDGARTKLVFLRPLFEGVKDAGPLAKVEAHASRAQFDGDIEAIVAKLRAGH